LTIGGSGKIGMTLKQRWDARWRTLGATKKPATTFDELVAAYSESVRIYHTLKHLEDCFSHFDSAKRLARYPAEIEVAIWFHDAIQDTATSVDGYIATPCGGVAWLVPFDSTDEDYG
jgi:predicted metal-dependent HD superfamily phosphohydrolase